MSGAKYFEDFGALCATEFKSRRIYKLSVKQMTHCTDLVDTSAHESEAVMESKAHHNEPSGLSDAEITMYAAEAFVDDFFEVASNDAQYHHSLSAVRDAVRCGQCSHRSEDIAERILAWSGAL